MLTLDFLYRHWNPNYESLSEKDQKRARISTRKRIVDVCKLTTNTATYQWQKNKGIIPLSRAIELSIHDTSIPMEVSDYLQRESASDEPDLCRTESKITDVAA